MRRRIFKSEKVTDLKELVNKAGELYSDKIAFKELGLNNEILEYSFNKLRNDVNALGTKLLDMGLKGHHIAIIGENSYSWIVSYLAIINGVGVAVPLDKELTDEDITKLLIQCDADAVVCSNTFVESIKSSLLKCPNIKTCVVMNPNKDNEGFHAISHLVEEGTQLLSNGNNEYVDASIDRDKMCEIVFTSGTTGANKGVMLSHKNIATVVNGALAYINPSDTSFSVLPISHTYECSCHILGGILSGITICINNSLKRVADNLNLFKPNFSIMVPLFLESMYRKIWKVSKENNLDGHLRYGIKVSNLIRKIGIDMRRLYFKPVLDSFGGNLSQIVSGGAPLQPEIGKCLTDLGIEILNGYGITECAPLVSTNSELWKKKGSVGRIIPGCRVKIDNPDKKGVGEILVKGDNVMLGYYKDIKNTKESFTKDGWFKTGDLGSLDRHNFLYINGRKKNLIVLSNGKNIHPEEVEETIIKKLPYVKEVVVYSPTAKNGIQDTITASIHVDKEYFIDKESSFIDNKLNQDIKILNRNLPVYKRITNVMRQESEFEKTSTRKIKRNAAIERCVENA